MKSRMRCLISAVVAAEMIIVVGLYGFAIGQEKKIYNNPVKEAGQNQVVVKDFIHDNYVISERNPWTDYGLHPINYTENNGNYTQNVGAKAAILVDVNNKNIVYQKNITERRAPASTTKLMTALTVLQILDVDDVVTIGDEIGMIAADSSKAGFSKGQVVTVDELLHGMLMASGNDAAYVLAKAAGQAIFDDNIENEGKTFNETQCVQRFILEMNKNVRDMELKNTHFMSPDGYDDSDQYTTAEDLSKIAIEAYKNKTIADICKTSSYNSKTLGKTWTSTNELINKNSNYYFKYCKGLKTGTTGTAGKCLVSVAKKGEEEYISVVLGEQTEESRFMDSKNLLEYGLQ